MSEGSDNNLMKDGVCRCCLTFGFFKDLTTTFDGYDNRETYSDIILYCFNIELKAMPFNIDSVICDECIEELRASYDFKIKIENSELNLFKRCLEFEACEGSYSGINDYMYDVKVDYSNVEFFEDLECNELQRVEDIKLKKKTLKVSSKIEKNASARLTENGQEVLQKNIEGKDDPNYGICRCCLSVGAYKSINKVCQECNDNKYLDVIAKCFNKELTAMTCNIISMICDVCVAHICSSYTLRTRIEECEQNLYNKSFDFDFRADDEITSKFLQIEYLDDDLIENGDTAETAVVSKKKRKRYNFKISVGDIDTISNKKGIYLPKFYRNLSEGQKIKGMFKKAKNEILASWLANSKIIFDNSTVYPFSWTSRVGCTCFFCGILFNDFNLLKKHTLTHRNEVVLTKLRRSFVLYNSTKVDVSEIKCKLCAERFDLLSEFKEHLSETHEIKFQGNKDGLIQFRLTKDFLTCCYCSLSFDNFHNLNIHTNVHFSNFVCDFCGTGFICKRRLEKHMQIHSSKSVDCNLCERKFKNIQSLESHKSRAHRAPMRTCKCHCGKHFKSFYSRQKHKILEHNEEHLLHRCEFCKVAFASRSVLSNHIKKCHLKRKIATCDLCGMSFCDEKGLDRHYKLHTKESKYECVLCHKKFGTKDILKLHMKVHMGNKRFLCGYCGTAFVYKCGLNVHFLKCSKIPIFTWQYVVDASPV